MSIAPIGIGYEQELVRAFVGCDTVVHLAGINLERAEQTYHRVHIEGTRNVVSAASQAGVNRIVVLSFLRARPGIGSEYHESKWIAEEIVRASGLDYTVVKAGIIFGAGDSMLGHLGRWLRTVPLFPMVGFRDSTIRPVAVEDVVRILHAALVDSRLSRRTVLAVGPEELTLGQSVRRIASVLGRRAYLFPLPVWAHYLAAWCFERIMTDPVLTVAQVRILAEGTVEPLPTAESLPADFVPQASFNEERIRNGLTDSKPYGLRDLRWLARYGRASNSHPPK
jgi:NADH dehydrogenase